MNKEYSVDVPTLKKVLIDKNLDRIRDFSKASGYKRNTIIANMNG